MDFVKKIRNSFENKKSTFYIVYTVLFYLTAFFCFFYFVFSGRSLVSEGDGWSQHLKALAYYSEYLRNMIRGVFFEGKWSIPDYDFYIGEGNDILSTLHYYVIGDPIALFSVFVPVKWMAYFFSLACIFRMYLAGISFSFLCFETRQKNHYAILAGAIQYSLCIWALVSSAKHPYFVNPLIYFPLMIAGVERILKDKGSRLFCVITAVSAISNFYFFYMIVLLTVIYVSVRVILIYGKNIRSIIQVFLRIGIASLVGVLIAGFIFLPILTAFLGDSRFGESQPFHLCYDLSYYVELPARALSGAYHADYWLHLGLTVPVLSAVILMFAKKSDKSTLKILFLLGSIFIIFPIFGRIFNGMSYMSNRWCWAFVLLCSYILVEEWNNLMCISAREAKVLFIVITAFCAYFIALIVIERSRAVSNLTLVAMMLLFVFALKFGDSYKKQLIFLLFVAVGVVNICFWKFSPIKGSYGFSKRCITYKEIGKEWEDNEAGYIKDLINGSYTRYSGTNITQNVNLLYKTSNTQYYWSISNPHLSFFREEVDTIDPRAYCYSDYDVRTTLNELSGVKYYINGDDDSRVPYGYEWKTDITDTTTKYHVYENKTPLSIGYCYDSYISADSWEKLNPVQKQEIELETAYTDEIPPGISRYENDIHEYTIPYDIELTGEVVQTDSGYVATSSDAGIKLILKKGTIDSETYVGVTGLEYVATPEYDLYFGDDKVDPEGHYGKPEWEKLSGSKKMQIIKDKIYWNPVVNCDIDVEVPDGYKGKIEYLQPDATFSSGKHDYILNIGYGEKGEECIIMKFPREGIYTFDSINVYSVPMGSYISKVEKLRENMLENINIDTDRLTGTITTEGTKMLCIAVPYSDGWRGYIDQKDTKLYCLNDRYIGLVVPKGDHSIEIRYSTPYKKEGMILSAIGIFVLLGSTLWKRKRKSKDMFISVLT